MYKLVHKLIDFLMHQPNISSLYTAVGTETRCHLNFTTATPHVLELILSKDLKMLELPPSRHCFILLHSLIQMYHQLTLLLLYYRNFTLFL